MKVSEHDKSSVELCRITCSVHQRLSPRVIDRLREIGVRSVLVENGRTVRLRRNRRRSGVGRKSVRLEDSPVELFRFSVPPEHAQPTIRSLIDAAEMDVPGRGAVFAQGVTEYVALDAARLGFANLETPAVEAPMLRDLSLITCVLSTSGGGENLARLALELGTGVPIVTLGTGTGMRDRLGLLRITVPPEKELVHLLVPAIDAEGVIRQLVEEGKLNRPGRGFVYSAAVQAGVLDTRLQIGPHEHAASIEQVVAAIDELKVGTAWRRRFPGLDQSGHFRLTRNHSEVVFVCSEERSGIFVDAAMRAGARGATTTRVRRLRKDEAGVGDAARERCIITVPSPIRDTVVGRILEAHEGDRDGLDFLETLPAPVAYTFQRTPVVPRS